MGNIPLNVTVRLYRSLRKCQFPAAILFLPLFLRLLGNLPGHPSSTPITLWKNDKKSVYKHKKECIMAASKLNDQLIFNPRTLRLIIGALAFAFPAAVIALTGKITTSISASYHEVQTRDVFVGFLFIIGALLISYKGHTQARTASEPRSLRERTWDWLKEYQEDVVSTIGGVAAIVTALSPTACDGCPMDTKANIHTIGAFILFSTVVYFCQIGFLRSLNQKLLGYAELKNNHGFMEKINVIRNGHSTKDANLHRQFWNYLTVETRTFLAIATEEFRKYDREKAVMKIVKVLLVHGKKIARGWVYVICGVLIALVLLVFIAAAWLLPDLITHSKATFLVETIALGFFGIAWMTASQLEYIRQIEDWLEARREKEPAATRADIAGFVAGSQVQIEE
jgi:hypothetical protein